MLRTFKQAPGRFLTGCCTSTAVHVEIGKLNSLVSISTSSVFSAKQNFDVSLLFMDLMQDQESDAGARSVNFPAHTAFMDEVQGKVKQLGARGFIEISSRNMAGTRVASVISDLSATRPSANSGEDVSREINFSSSSYMFCARVSLTYVLYLCLRVPMCVHLGTRSDDDEDRVSNPRGGSPTLSRLTTVMGVNGHDVSRHGLRIVKADPPASDHSLVRETKRVSRTSELPDVQVEPRRQRCSSSCTTRPTRDHAIAVLGVTDEIYLIGSTCFLSTKKILHFLGWRKGTYIHES